jgi:hypothetical protein
MNKIHTLTKVTLTLTALFFIIRIVPQLMIPFYWLYQKPSWEVAGAMLFSLLVAGGAVAALVYAFIYKRDVLARRIVGSQGRPESTPEIQWLPTVLRLICIAGGIYFLSTALWQATNILSRFAFVKAQGAYSTYGQFSWERIFVWVVTVTCGIYLLCGAPHFVRWQVKKTLQQCKDRVKTT